MQRQVCGFDKNDTKTYSCRRILTMSLKIRSNVMTGCSGIKISLKCIFGYLRTHKQFDDMKDTKYHALGLCSLFHKQN